MKIALIGYGKMGQLVERAALTANHTVSVIIDPKQPVKKITPDVLADADVCIDFTKESQVVENILAVARLGLPVVVGTTGWLDRLDEVKRIVQQSDIGLLYSPNFSMGVYLYLKMLKQAGALIAGFEEYDVSGFEIHHNQKLDNPSGTAHAIADCLNRQIKRKKDTIRLTGIRVGYVPGTHTVIFDSPHDSITITHTAKNREGFARGAIKAAEWLVGKKGFFTLEDMYEKN